MYHAAALILIGLNPNAFAGFKPAYGGGALVSRRILRLPEILNHCSSREEQSASLWPGGCRSRGDGVMVEFGSGAVIPQGRDTALAGCRRCRGFS